MPKVLFNIDDLSLILVISSSLIFILTLLCGNSGSNGNKGRRQRFLLSAFLLSVATSSLNILLYWSIAIKEELHFLQPHTLIFLSTARFLSAPLLFFYASSVIFNDFKFTKKTLLHAVPAAIYVVLIPFIYLTLGKDNWALAVDNYGFFYSNFIYHSSIWASHISLVAYTIATYLLLRQHQSRVEDISSNTDGVDGNWLKLLTLGFLSFWLFGLGASLCHELGLGEIAQMMGLIGNYVLFALVNLLVMLSLTRSTRTTQQSPEVKAANAHDYTEEQVNRLANTMKDRSPFLNPDLTLEDLSKITSIPQRTLSSIINRHHKYNFFEYINCFRVAKAAELLIDNPNKLSMLDIMNESGFNSKSAFNRFFKKFKGMTPTQYKSDYKAKQNA